MTVSGVPVGLEAPQGRVVPQSAEAEAAVLGAMLLDAAAIGRALETGLREEDFYHDHHRTIFRSVLRLYDARQAVDPVTLRDDLRRHAELDRAGGEEYLAELVSAVPTTANVEYHTRIVLEYAIKRRLIAVGTEIVGDVYDRADEPDSLLDRAEKRIFEIAERRLRPGFVHIKPLLHQTVELLDRISQNPDEVTGVPSGFRDLDRLTAGFQLSDLIIVAGRPGSGKTSLALNVAMHASLEHPFPVAVFSLEMSRDQLVQRLLCSEARVDSKKLRFEWKRPERFKYIIDVVNRLYNAKLYIDDTPSISVLEMRAKARRLKSEVDLGLIVVDYLQLMEVGPGFRRAENRQQEITVISRALKALAKELNVPVLALSQLSRAAEQHPGPPRLSDLRECVTGDTLVVLTDGRRAPIAELEGQTPDVYAIAAGGRIVRARADRVWRVGRRPVFEMRLASGRRMRATARHRLLTGDGWKRLEGIGIGERVAIARHAPEPLAPDRWPEERLILLAHLIGDGSYEEREATSDLFWDRVVGVVACGEADVYDLTVPGPASWLADGIVSHNSGSIEQDSDLVLFLYQEQDGGKSERGGFEAPLDQTTLVMDLIVAKHRNGPTGSMKLVFNRPFTRFESYSGRTEF